MNNYGKLKAYSGCVYCLDAQLCLAPPLDEHSKVCRSQIQQSSLKNGGGRSQPALERPTLQLSIALRMIANHQGAPLL